MATARCVVLMRIKIFTDLLLGWVFRWQSVGIRLSRGGQSSKQRRGQKHFRLRQQHCFSFQILRFLISYLYLCNCVLALPHPTASTTTENGSTIMPQSAWCGKRGSAECGGSGACCPSGLTCVRGGVYETSDGLKIVQPICVDLSLIPTQQTIANQPTSTPDVTSSLDVTSSPTPTNTATSQTTNDTRNGLALTKEGIIIITSAGSGAILILLIVMFCIGRRRGKREAINEKPPSNPSLTNRVSGIPEIRISDTYQCLEAADSEVRRVIPTAELEGESWFPWSRNQGSVHELPAARSVRSHVSLASRVAAALSRTGSIYATSTNSDETRTCGNTLAQGLFPARTAAAAVGGGAAMVSQFNFSRPPATLVSAIHDSSSSAGQPQNSSQSTHTSKKKHYPVPPLPQLPQAFRCNLPSVPERARLLRTPGLNFSNTSGPMRGAMATQMRWV